MQNEVRADPMWLPHVGVEDPRGILDRLHGRKSALENVVSCDRVFEI
jgi:hypothetical protein